MIEQLPVIITLAAFVGGVAYAALCDLTTYTIPNRVSLVLLGAFAVFAPLSGLPLETLAWHLAAFAVVFAGGFAMFALGWMGGGDVKLAASAALWIGWTTLLEFLFAATLVGGAFTIALLVARSLPLPLALGRVDWISRLHHPKSGVPYGVALAAGALLVLPLTPAWTVAFGA